MIETEKIESLPRTSPNTIKRFKALNINTYADLAGYYPYRYENFSITSPIGTIQPGERVAIKGTITKIKTEYTRRRITLQKATLTDATGAIDLLWYNQPYLVKLLENKEVWVAGSVELTGKKLGMKPEEYELEKNLVDKPIHLGRLVPVYEQIYGLSTKTIREKMYYVLNEYVKGQNMEYLPTEIVDKYNFLHEAQALYAIHFPENMKEVEAARTRLSFDELFTRVLFSKLVRKTWHEETSTHPYKFDKTIEKKVNTFINSFPFTLTGAQKRSVDEILEDLKKSTPMNRFLQGDVGSGKTAVAAVACYISYLNGFQSLVMAPTAILATQHFNTLQKLFADSKVKVAIQTQANKTFTKKNAETRQYNIIVGTQALLTGFLEFDKVGLVVVDEQHRFGVRQRAILKQKGANPHLLTMTATPIPRTVSLTLYSELDLSIIDEMPKGRLPIKTYVVSSAKRDDGYKWIKAKIKKDKEQVYIICSLIEESESETLQTVKAATKEYEYLKTKVFPDCKVALLHGKMKGKEKDEVMKLFKEKKFDILVSTSVVEVGIDVPNATIMIIEGAERFGLAQLHQLRGRVGRSDKQSFCFLYTSTKQDEDKYRLKFFANTNSGMKLAEFDLKMRGPGELYGTSQSGRTELKIADLTDIKLVHAVKDSVEYFMKTYQPSDFPKLKQMIDTYQVKQISRD
jgi:ATP-dependent DNA helicase RecG